MPEDKEIIQAAFENELKGIFATFMLGTISSGLETAAQRFTKGLGILRQVRERAIQIVGQPPVQMKLAKRAAKKK